MELVLIEGGFVLGFGVSGSGLKQNLWSVMTMVSLDNKGSTGLHLLHSRII